MLQERMDCSVHGPETGVMLGRCVRGVVWRTGEANTSSVRQSVGSDEMDDYVSAPKVGRVPACAGPGTRGAAAFCIMHEGVHPSCCCELDLWQSKPRSRSICHMQPAGGSLLACLPMCAVNDPWVRLCR